MSFYDKEKIRDALDTDQLFKLVEHLGGEPVLTNFGFVAKTICHNHSGEGSEKLYFYENTGLFNCYTNCDIMDVFQLVIQSNEIETNEEMSFYESMNYIVKFFNLDGVQGEIKDNKTPVDEDFSVLSGYRELDLNRDQLVVEQKIYKDDILNHLDFVAPHSWLQEGISEKTMEKYNIRYYSTEHKIVIPHYNMRADLIGIRGRSLVKRDVELFGKYMPLRVNNKMYSHPLSQNLYGLNHTLENIINLGKVIIFEGER